MDIKIGDLLEFVEPVNVEGRVVDRGTRARVVYILTEATVPRLSLILFSPKKPVRAGESWSPDLKALAASIDPDMAAGIDFARSSSKLTLTSVETRGGVDFGTIDGEIQFALGQMGPMKLGVPVPMKMTVHLVACIDGKQPDGVMRMDMTMKGQTTADGPMGKMDLGIDITMTGLKTVKTVK